MNAKEKRINDTALKIYNEVQRRQEELHLEGRIDSEIYYKDFTLIQPNDNIGLAEQDVYVVKIIDENEKPIYQIYNENMLIAEVDENGKISFTEEFKEYVNKIDARFGETIDSNNQRFHLIDELDEEDKLFSAEELEEMREEQMYGETERSRASKEVAKDSKEPNKEEKSKIDTEEEKLEEIAKELGIDRSDIVKYSKINPKERVAENETFESVAGVEGRYDDVYAVKLNSKAEQNSRFAFIGVSKEGAEMIPLRRIGQPNTDKSVISISRDGQTVQELDTTENFLTKDYNKRFSITLGQNGNIEVNYIRRSPEENKYIAAPVSTQYSRESIERVNKFMNQNRNSKQDVDEIVKIAEHQIDETGETNMTLIDDNPYNDSGYDANAIIKMHDGNETTLAKEAEKYDMDLDEYINKIEKAEGDCTADKIEVVNAELDKEKAEKENNQRTRLEPEEHIGREERLTPEDLANMRRGN